MAPSTGLYHKHNAKGQEESFDDIKSTNHKLEKALSEIHKLNQQLTGRVVELEKENQRKDETIDNLEKAVESLEMYSKKNNVVFSGLDLKATIFARVAQVAGTAEEQGVGEQTRWRVRNPES